MVSNPANIVRHRYPGVKPFSADEKSLFFGREQDVDALRSLIFVNQIVVLHAKSGYGKSSLLNAGIIPELQYEKTWVHLLIRFNDFSERKLDGNLSPVENVRLRIKQYALNEEFVSPLDSIIPNENSFWYWIKNCQYMNGGNKFILFFDQFEELFTYSKEEVAEFSEQLSQLLYNTIPVKFRKRLAEMDEYEVEDSLHDFLYEKLEVKVVFSVRSDRLSLLYSLSDRHPDILRNCYLLNALSREQAAQAIVEPARKNQIAGFETPSFEFADGAVEKIIDSIADPLDGEIEAATLQIICRYLENELVAEKRITYITGELLGDITAIFRQYYEAILSKFTVEECLMIQHLIEDELIDNGKRNYLFAGYIQRKFGLTQQILDTLEMSSLLRKEIDAKGRLFFEISHDTLVHAIDKVAIERRTVEDKQQKIILEQKIFEEGQRSAQLILLNKKVVFRSRLATALTIICLFITACAIYAFGKAKDDERKANAALAEKIKQEALSMAKQNMGYGDRYQELGKINEACDSYNAAIRNLANYHNEKTYQELVERVKLCK
jgi:PBP1b-binding outer membrane lipoprotein LpoB